jgi:phosphohistidine swiveling domain-containing protein
VSDGWVKVVDRSQTVFAAVLVSVGLREEFRQATGWDFAVEQHRYDGSAHWVSGADYGQLAGIVGDQAASEPRFWLDYMGRAVAAGDRLLGTARSLAGLAHGTVPLLALGQGLSELSDAMRRVAPYPLATPQVQAVLERRLSRLIEIEAPVGGTPLRHLRGTAHPEALAEMLDCYRIGVELASNPQAAEVLRNTSPAAASGWVDEHRPELAAHIRRHVHDYAWLWGPPQLCAARTPVDLMERMQGVLLRWPVDAVCELAAPSPGPALEDLLRFPPSDELAELLVAYRRLTTEVTFRIEVMLKAESIAAPFFGQVADVLGCTRAELMWSTPQEIDAALADTAPLPAADIGRRLREGFIVEGAQHDLRVLPAHGDQTTAVAPVLQGVSASRGVAVGTVKILFAGAEIGRLGMGDVLVTATSSPDVLGGASMFPTRAGLSGIEQLAAIVTDEGGALSHAGIVSREYGIPCVVGTGQATSTLVDGQVVEVDARRPTGLVAVLG